MFHDFPFGDLLWSHSPSWTYLSHLVAYSMAFSSLLSDSFAISHLTVTSYVHSSGWQAHSQVPHKL